MCGDSGSLVANVQGHIGGLLTGGTARSLIANRDITYVIPIGFILRCIDKTGIHRPYLVASPPMHTLCNLLLSTSLNFWHEAGLKACFILLLAFCGAWCEDLGGWLLLSSAGLVYCDTSCKTVIVYHK